MANVTTAIILDTRKPNKKLSTDSKEDFYPVKLRITYKRKFRLYNLNCNLTKEQFETITTKNPRKEELKKIKIELSNKEAEAREKIEKMELFSFDSFKEIFKIEDYNSNDVYANIQRYVTKLKKEKRLGTAESYELTEKSFKKLKQKLTFTDITPEFLKEYESYMLENEKSYTTIGIYTRNLRAIYNDAIRKGQVDHKFYPFGKGKYEIPLGVNIKKALKMEEIEKIFNYETPDEKEDFSKDMWVFSYLTNGININDIARLRYKNIVGDTIKYYRRKTINTAKRNQREIVAMVTDITANIIKKWGNEQKPENYIFNILRPGLSAEKERATIKQLTKDINKHLKKIAFECNIDKNITTYSARHSFSTTLKRTGAPIEFISESLGHHDLKTTQSYLDSFEDETKKQFLNKLIDFNK